MWLLRVTNVVLGDCLDDRVLFFTPARSGDLEETVLSVSMPVDVFLGLPQL
jgi:hypothetical protein